CLFKEEGFSLSFVTTPYIHFFIPHNWANDEDNLNHLNIKLFNTNLVLRHPLSSKKESNEINLPLNELNIGWNKIYIRKRRNKVQVVTDNSGSRKGVQNFTLSEDFDSFLDPQSSLVTGLYSLGKCLNEFTTIFERNHLLDYLSFCTRKQINSWLFRKRIHSILMSFVVEKDRKYVKMAKIPSTLSPSVKNVKTDQFRPFLQTLSTMCSFLQSFRPEDNLNYNHSAFVDLVLENIGNDDFFVEMEVINPSSAPISLLKGTEGSIIFPDTVSESVGVDNSKKDCIQSRSLEE
ncbi:Venom peptide isomerase heavy chain, partial [Armadillidium vulgare]